MEKRRWEESERRRKEVRRSEREKVRRKKMQVHEKVGKSRFTVFFHWFVALEGRKVGSLELRVWSQLARWEMRNCMHAVLAQTTFPSQNVQRAPTSEHCWWSFGVSTSKKCRLIWREAHFELKSVKKMTVSDHFWKWACRKSVGRCGAKHISKSKCWKHHMLGPLLEVEMSIKCIRLWSKAHLEVKSVKNLWFWAFFETNLTNLNILKLTSPAN